ncbi:MAG TPA: O-antigen ligase family protein, partial [Chloroflexota bacterium]|nr:O-antigen ligase family protein [Chloroflexota bacterium]
ITLHGNVHTVESIFPHEQSFFFNDFLSLAAILFLYGGSPLMKRVVLWLLPFVLVASLANQRRAAILALVVGFLVLLLVTAVAHPGRRRVVVKVLLLLALVLPPYYLAYKNSTGLIGEPAHSFASAFTPDSRDASSNLYRVNEDKDILATMRLSPIIGYGYGKPMITPYPLANISNVYIFWNIMPHDSILWVWMRLGTIGYLFFWLLIGTAIGQAASFARASRHPPTKGIAVFILLLVVQEVIFGYLDLQWTNYRNLITLGVLLALLGKLAAFQPPGVEPKASTPARPRPRGATRSLPSSLAVRDGRIRREGFEPSVVATPFGGVLKHEPADPPP